LAIAPRQQDVEAKATGMAMIRTNGCGIRIPLLRRGTFLNPLSGFTLLSPRLHRDDARSG